MKDEMKQELDSFKYGLHAIKEEILNKLRFLHTLNSSTHDEEYDNKNVESLSYIWKNEVQLEKKRVESLTFDHSLL